MFRDVPQVESGSRLAEIRSGRASSSAKSSAPINVCLSVCVGLLPSDGDARAWRPFN